MFDFFFDTANIDYIKKVWGFISPYSSPTNIVGITTNPSAMHKEGLTSLKSWEDHLPKLCSLVSTLRGDDKGVVYVQMPSCDMSGGEALAWAKHISKFTDGNTRLGLKIPPYREILKLIPELNNIMETNVTGVSDAETALSCMSFGPRYVSIIPGRMEEVGINAKEHLLFIIDSRSSYTEIISGSMRTPDGLKMTVQAGTVPTIGNRVWDQLIDPEFNLEEFLESTGTDMKVEKSDTPLTVVIDERNHKLSKDFFQQMNELGREVYQHWGRKNL